MIDGIYRHQDSNGGGLITDGDTPVDDRGSKGSSHTRRAVGNKARWTLLEQR
jgi:hypothetical protein